MTKLPFVHWCHHLTEIDPKWRPVDFKARVIVRGMKQEPFGGYFNTTIGGVEKHITEANVEELIDFLMPLVGRRLREDIEGPISIVPIPNSGMAVGQHGPFRSVELARKVAAGFGEGATVRQSIWWDTPRQKAHEGNDYRHPDLYEPHMRLGEAPEAQVVLFDDVLTSGSQMIAAARMLTKLGYAPQRGLVVARATKQQHEGKLWEKHEDTLDLSDEPFDFDEI
jgi:hypothetical protein